MTAVSILKEKETGVVDKFLVLDTDPVAPTSLFVV